MIKKTFHILFFPFIVFAFAPSCKNKNIIVPPHIIAQDTMVKILSELHMMEALYINGNLTHVDSVNSVAAYKKGIMEKYNVGLERFDEGFRFYAGNVELLDKLYTEVLNELNAKKAEAEN